MPYVQNKPKKLVLKDNISDEMGDYQDYLEGKNDIHCITVI